MLSRRICHTGSNLAPRLVHLDRFELEPLRVGIDRVDDAAAPGGERTDVEVVGGRHRKADEPLAVERGHDERDVRTVARARVGVVVHDDVAGADRVAALGELAQHPLHVPRNGAGLERGGLGGLGEPLSVRVHEPGAEVFRLADDRRVRHAHELVAHLGRDILERTLNDAHGDRVHPAVGAARRAAGPARRATDPAVAVSAADLAAVRADAAAALAAAGAAARRRAVAHGESSMVMMRLPGASAQAALPGGMTVVESRCSTTAGPGKDSPTGRRSRR